MKKIFLIVLFIAVLAGFLWFVLANRTRTKAASSRKFLLSENANNLSFTDAAADSSVFSLQADKSYLYKNERSNTPAETAAAFLADNPSLDTGKILLPENMLRQTTLVKQLSDGNDPLLKGHGISGKSSHFLYQQSIDGIPVYGASLSVHIRNDNEVYSLSGALATSQSVADGNVTRQQAEEVALAEAGRKIKNPRIASVEEIIFNGKILGLSGDGVNEASWKVNVEGGKDNPFSVHYFISKIDGRIIYTEDYMRFAKHRNVYDCGGGVDQCPLSRTENEPAVNRGDVDGVYDLTGTVYDYYSSRFSRDSYDNSGAAINSLANLSTQPEAKCPNAFWLGGHTDPAQDILGVCQGLVANDVIAHELSHAVIEKSAPLVYEKQTGAINESLADIFAYGVDPDWQMGEDTSLGVIRDLSQPEAMAITARRQPERLFSPLYYCTGQGNGESCSSANDYCGVHKNGGVIGKGFYLMVTGGSFNGCQISGIGGERALLVMYQVLTRHLQASDNFRAFYAKAVLACGELYGAGSATCNEVQKSLQAVEIDQQPENESLAAPCIGQTRQPATCSSTTVTATVTPSPSPTPSGTPAETPTTTPGMTPTATMTPTPPPNITATPTTTPIPSGPDNVKITLHLPGINVKPANDKMNFDIYFADEADGRKYDFAAREFIADDQGRWTAKLHLDFTAQSRFSLYIKGPFHTRKKICDMFPGETYPDTYRCSRGNIILRSGGIAGAPLVNPIDLTGIMLPAGDLQPQDGVITAYDIALVRNNLGSRNPTILRMADVNLDGVIDTADYSLIIASLSIKTDEE